MNNLRRFLTYKEYKAERECNIIELQFRRLYSGIFYHRIYRKKYPESPFYTPAAIKTIKKTISGDSLVFEWGSGVSSLWFAKQIKNLQVIEHNPEWFSRVKQSFESSGITNAEITLMEPSNADFTNYIEAINQYPDDSFDVIAVDGRERVKCVEQAIPKLKPGGILILDDSHRPKYKGAFKILKNFDKRIYDFGLLQTTIFIKPII